MLPDLLDGDMAIALNHTIIWCRDNRVSSVFLAEMFD